MVVIVGKTGRVNVWLPSWVVMYTVVGEGCVTVVGTVSVCVSVYRSEPGMSGVRVEGVLVVSVGAGTGVGVGPSVGEVAVGEGARVGVGVGPAGSAGVMAILVGDGRY